MTDASGKHRLVLDQQDTTVAEAPAPTTVNTVPPLPTVNAPHPKDPAASPAAKYTTILIGLVLLALAGVAGREVWVLTQDDGTQSWLKPVLNHLSTVTEETWLLPAGIGAVMVGVLLIYISFRPRTKTHRRLKADTNMWLRPVDVARLCTAHAEKTPGVLRAHTVATKRSVTVTVHGDTTDPQLLQRVENTVRPLVNLLDKAPSLKVKMSKKEEIQ